MKVALKWNGRDYSVPASEFAGIADVCMASVRIVSTMPPKLVVSPPDGGFAFIAVCMEYGDPILMKGREPVSGEAIYHRARAFFLFDKKGYSHRSRLVPIEKDNKWRLLYKDVATQEQGFGEESGPFEPNSPPMVPVTEWPDAEIPSAPPSADRTTAIPRKAEQADADQPLTKPANKTPTEVHPPLPTSEDAPR